VRDRRERLTGVQRTRDFLIGHARAKLEIRRGGGERSNAERIEEIRDESNRKVREARCCATGHGGAGARSSHHQRTTYARVTSANADSRPTLPMFNGEPLFQLGVGALAPLSDETIDARLQHGNRHGA
jgi:hypothetical protein